MSTFYRFTSSCCDVSKLHRNQPLLIRAFVWPDRSRPLQPARRSQLQRHFRFRLRAEPESGQRHLQREPRLQFLAGLLLTHGRLEVLQRLVEAGPGSNEQEWFRRLGSLQPKPDAADRLELGPTRFRVAVHQPGPVGLVGLPPAVVDVQVPQRGVPMHFRRRLWADVSGRERKRFLGLPEKNLR